MVNTRKVWRDGLAIIAGRGSLPQLLAEKCRDDGLPYIVVELENVPLNWLGKHPIIHARLEHQDHLLASIRKAHCDHVVLAGGMERIPFDATELDEKGKELASLLASSKFEGDDGTLRAIISYLESNDLNVVAAHDIVTELVPEPGVLTKTSPSSADQADAVRASEIVKAIGKVDVGQSAVVGQGICLALESISGTDHMLSFAALHRKNFLPDPSGSAGLLFKAPKPDQDRRVDLPAIGPDTVRRASEAGLAGVVVEAGGVMILEPEETIKLADDLGLFLWVRPAV